jgi:hypothetical protein
MIALLQNSLPHVSVQMGVPSEQAFMAMPEIERITDCGRRRRGVVAELWQSRVHIANPCGLIVAKSKPTPARYRTTNRFLVARPDQ